MPGADVECEYVIKDMQSETYKVEIRVPGSYPEWRMRHRLPNHATLDCVDSGAVAAKTGGSLVDVTGESDEVVYAFSANRTRFEDPIHGFMMSGPPELPHEAKLWSDGIVHKISFGTEDISLVGRSGAKVCKRL